MVFFTSDNGSPRAPDGNLPLRGYKTQVWEGGYREPGIVWWPGKVKAGVANNKALVATYDIFPTIIALAGGEPISDRVIDGVDLSNLLLSDNPETQAGGHRCIMFYHRPQSELGPEDAKRLTSLSAVRCGDYKAYWFIDRIAPDQPFATGVNITAGMTLTLDTPVIFDLRKDPSEKSPLKKGSSQWVRAKKATLAARAAHIKTLGWAPNQIGLGRNSDYAICADPHSQKKYPNSPNCSLPQSLQFWSNPFCKCKNHFMKCSECPTPAPASAPLPVSADCAAYHRQCDNKPCCPSAGTCTKYESIHICM